MTPILQPSQTTVTNPQVPARPSAKRYVALVVAGVAILQALWIAVVPPFRGSDEFDHAYRAAGVAAGQWRATETPIEGRGLLVRSPRKLVEAAHDQCAALSYTGPDNCSPVDALSGGEVLVASGAGGYNPAFYWVVGTVAEPFSGTNALYAMRVTASTLCLLFIGLAAWAVGARARSPWSRAGLIVAITPVMLYSTSLPAPNGLEMSAALAFWCALLSLNGSLPTRHERAVLLVAVASASVLMVDRLLGPLFALLALLTVWALYPSLVRRMVAVHRRLLLAGSAVVLVAAGWAIAWYYLHDSVQMSTEKQGGEWRWTALILWPMQTIAAFPFRDQPGAAIVYPVVLLIFGGLVWAGLKVGRMRARVVLGLTIAGALGLPLLVTAVTYEGRGVMWQGRYGLPYALGIVLLATAVLDARGLVTRWRPGLLGLGATLMAISTAACFIKVLNQELARDVSALDPTWHAPGPLVVILGSIVSWSLLFLAIRGPRRVDA